MKSSTVGLIVVSALVLGGVTLYALRGTNEQPHASESTSTLAPVSDSLRLGTSAEPLLQEAEQTQAAVPVQAEVIEAAVVPIPVSQEFDRIFKNQNPGANTAGTIRMHARLESQARDQDWAATTENGFRDFYTGKPELHLYRTPEVDCRTSICEVRLLAYGSSKDADYWYQLVSKPGAIPMPAGAMPLVLAWDPQEGMTAVIVHMMFSRPDIEVE